MCDAGNLIAGNGGCLIPAGPEVGVAFFHVVVHNGELVFYRGTRRKRKDSAKRFGKRENTPQAGQCEKAYAGEDADAEGLFREVFHPRKLSTSIQS